MNTNILLAFSLAAVASVQAGTEENYLDRLSPKAREFVEKYNAEKSAKKANGNIQTKKVVLKNDVLGRKLKKGQVKDSTVYLVKDEAEPKMEVIVNDLTVEDSDIEPLGPVHYSYNDETKKEAFWLNGKQIDKASFLKKTEDWENRRIKKIKPLKKPYKALLTPSEMVAKLQSSEDLYIEDEKPVAEPNYYSGSLSTRGYGTYTVYYATRDEALQTSQLKRAHNDGYKGNDIGIYFMELGCANSSQIPYRSRYTSKNCGGKTDLHATGVTDVLQLFAPSATVYGYDSDHISSTGGPDNPMSSSFSPKIYIGTVSLGYAYDNKYTNKYESVDAAFDNYIYNTGVTAFINAGNLQNDADRQPKATIHSPGKAANAITVGAADPYLQYSPTGSLGYNYLQYSCHINPETGAPKPEIMNLAGFYDAVFPSEYGHAFNGTSSSTPFSAAMAAVLMSKSSFIKGHPEVVKPIFLTSTAGHVFNNRDTDGGAAPGIPSFDLMAYSKSYSGYWPKGNDQTLFKDGNGNSKNLEVTLNNLVAGEKYKLAVAYLTKGSTVKKLKKLPLNWNVSVYQNGKSISSYTANNNNQQYIMQTFTVPKSGSVTIRIKRNSNAAPDDKIAIGYHMVKVP